MAENDEGAAVAGDARHQSDGSFKYGQIEAAIASMHNVPPEAMATFRSRVKHFQRIGLVPSSPGKGQKIKYKLADAALWALCFEFTEFGLAPEQVKTIIKIGGDAVTKAMLDFVPTEDWFFATEGDLFEQHISNKPHTVWGTFPASKIRDLFFSSGRYVPRLMIVNLTHMRRQLSTALGIDW
jgi:hypothetical protein